MSSKTVILHWAVVTLIAAACTKYERPSDAAFSLRFSADTLRFDTVFTTFGSTTHRLIVYNPNHQTVLTHVSRRGNPSPFRYNVDGMSLTDGCDVEIAGRDSIYVFVEVTAHPQNSDLPIRILDSVQFKTGAHLQQVYSEAYGQDVVILKNAVIGNETWQSAKPYLIEGALTVDTLQTLHIKQGTRIFLAPGADMRIKGTLIAEGSVEHPILFSGMRMEKSYRKMPGQWGSILLTTASRDNLLQHVEIRNGTNGLLTGSPAGSNPLPFVKLDAVSIHDMSYSGLMCFSSDLYASNCLVYNCNYYTVGLFCGGNSQFVHCTFANHYSSLIKRKGIPVFSANSSYQNHTGVVPLSVSCFNSIIEGNANEELSLGTGISFRFNHCLLRTRTDASLPGFETVFTGIDPMFAEPEEGDFNLSETSPARDAGNREWAETEPLDMRGNSRLEDHSPDLGAFEWKNESLE
jgi:hypothetical protein